MYYPVIILSLDVPAFEIQDRSVSNETRQKWLLDLCEQLVTKFVFGESAIQTLVEQTQTLQDVSSQPIICRAEDCQATYVHHSKRVRYICLNVAYL